MLSQAGGRHVILFMELNDLAGPGGFFPPSEVGTQERLAYRDE